MPEIETLTEEERALADKTIADLSGPRTSLLAKLLRLHDALQARVKELTEGDGSEPVVYLRGVPSLEQRERIAAALAPDGVGCLGCNELKRERNETMRLLEQAQARVKELESAASTWVETTGARIRELETQRAADTERLGEAAKLFTWGANECEPALSDFPEAALAWVKKLESR